MILSIKIEYDDACANKSEGFLEIALNFLSGIYYCNFYMPNIEIKISFSKV